MAAKRGGKRPGAGRPAGARSRATKQMNASLSELAREHTATALNVLVEVAKKGESDSARVAAANATLDRGYGKPSQSHEHTGAGGGPIQTVDLTRLSEDELDRLETILGPLAINGGDQGGEGEAEG